MRDLSPDRPVSPYFLQQMIYGFPLAKDSHNSTRIFMSTHFSFEAYRLYGEIAEARALKGWKAA